MAISVVVPSAAFAASSEVSTEPMNLNHGAAYHDRDGIFLFEASVLNAHEIFLTATLRLLQPHITPHKRHRTMKCRIDPMEPSKLPPSREPVDLVGVPGSSTVSGIPTPTAIRKV